MYISELSGKKRAETGSEERVPDMFKINQDSSDSFNSGYMTGEAVNLVDKAYKEQWS